jgi:glycosyltransferase involved in cell wall biosynthesis
MKDPHCVSEAIGIYSPMSLQSTQGNAVSARRIATLLCDAGWQVHLFDQPPQQPLAVFVVLNAWRSAAILHDYLTHFPRARSVALLTGTDVFPALQPATLATLKRVDAAVAWHARVAPQLPESLWDKVRVIPKSVPDAAQIPAALPEFGRVLVLAHLRSVKRPFTAAAALSHIEQPSALHVELIGGERELGLAQQARTWELQEPRFAWRGSLERSEVFASLSRAWLTINSSEAEGGANAVVESILAGVPVLASAIDGNKGLLGESYPGYFPVDDAAALANLLHRCEQDADFYASLKQVCEHRKAYFTPEAEQAGWERLLHELIVKS